MLIVFYLVFGAWFSVPFTLYVIIRALISSFETKKEAKLHQALVWLYSILGILIAIIDMPSANQDQTIVIMIVIGLVVYAAGLSAIISWGHHKLRAN